MNPIYKLLSWEEGKDSMTLHYLDHSGNATSFTFGDEDSKHEFVLLAYMWGGRLSDNQPPHQVTFLLYKDGEPTKSVGLSTDGSDDGAPVSHALTVEAPKDQALRLKSATEMFLHGTAQTLGRFRQIAILTDVEYESDAFSLSYNSHFTLKLGIGSSQRRSVAKFMWECSERHLGFTRLLFWFTDEKGEQQYTEFFVPPDRIDEIAESLRLHVGDKELVNS